MVGGLVLDDKALVSFDSLEDVRLFDGPLPDISPLLVLLALQVLLGVGRLPPRLPVVGELLKERRLKVRGLVIAVELAL